MVARWLVAASVLVLLVSGCVGSSQESKAALAKRQANGAAQTALMGGLNWLTDGFGVPLRDIPGSLAADLSQPLEVALSYTGAKGGEPNIGVTKSGNVFVVASGVQTMRSKDHGLTWSEVYNPHRDYPPGPLNGTSDPMLWVDPVTNRVFTDHMFSTYCSNMAYSDNEGDTWQIRPLACGIPSNDHQKWASAPWSAKGPVAMLPHPYPSVVYYCYNKSTLPVGGSWCAVSYNGGLAFTHDQPVVSRNQGAPCGGINGHPAWAPDGTVYLPVTRGCGRPVVGVTEDNGVTWSVRLGPTDHGAVEIDPEVTVTPDGTAYFLWRGADQQQYLARSKDKFVHWEGPWKVSPSHLQATVFAGMTSGDNGRIAMAYLGTEQNITWENNPRGDPSFAPNGTNWNLYVTYGLNAADKDPVFMTVQANPSEDPIQRGCVWLSGGGNPCRNLLDFIDMASDKDGRIFIALTDGCTKSTAAGECAFNPSATNDFSRSRDNAVAIAVNAPSLRADHARIETPRPALPWS